MDDEMHSCSVDDFIGHYLPFLPAPEWVDAALEHLATEGQLFRANEGNDYVWNAYRQPPSQISQNEEKVFRHLKDIIDKLAKVDCPRGTRNGNIRMFSYKECPGQFMKTEITGSNFKADAIMTSNSDSTYPISAETAVAMEFKKKDKEEDTADVSFTMLGKLNSFLHYDAEPLQAGVSS